MITKLLCCAIIAVIFVGVESRAPAPKVCKTKECEKLAKRIAESIDTTVDPCDNFYNYACRKWATGISVPADHSMWDPFLMVKQTINHRLKVLLEADSKSGDLLPIKQAKKWYKLCMNTGIIEARGIKPIQSILSEIGGWPMAMNEADWDASKFTWKMVNNFYARKTGNYFLWNIDAYYIPKDEELGTINLNEPEFPFSDEFPRGEEDIGSDSWHGYRSLISDVVKTFAMKNGVTIGEKRLKNETEELIKFERLLLILTQEGKSYESEFAETPPLAKQLIQYLFHTVNITVNPETTVAIGNYVYFGSLKFILGKVDQRIIVNYLHWRFVQKMMIHTSEEMSDIVLERVAKKQLGIKMKPLRSTKCVDDIAMRHALSYLYVKKYFSKSKERTVKELVDNIHSALWDKINGSKWMDKLSMAVTKEKLNSMNFFLALPEWYNNETAFIEFHKGIEIEDEHFETVLNFMRWDNHKKLRKYSMFEPPFDGFSADDRTPITTNAFYLVETNSAVFPEADFEIPFFSPHYPPAANYGFGGAVVGHEMAHGFDDCGICYAKHGNMTSLKKSILHSYYRRADCFVKQFNKYRGNTDDVQTEWACGAMYNTSDAAEDTVKLTDGEVTSSENIADTTGLQAVYLAYKKISEEKFPQGEERLPGLESISDDQLFFISFGGLWCEAMTPEQQELSENDNDEHSNTEIRIIGAVSNTVGFATAFNCSENSPMNPKNKCAIWDQPKPKRSKNAYNKRRG